MATNNTYLNALEDLVIKGNLTVEGNVTQVSTTINENRVEAEEFIINADGENATAKLTLNSNNSLANISFTYGGNLVVEPNIQGNVSGRDSLSKTNSPVYIIKNLVGN